LFRIFSNAQNLFRIFSNVQNLFRIFRNFQNLFRIFRNVQNLFRILSNVQNLFSNFQNLFRIFRVCSEFWVIFRIFRHFSEFLAQKLVYSESLDFVVIVSSNPTQGEVYFIEHFCDKVFRWLVSGFLQVLQFSPSIKPTTTEILLKVALNTITPTSIHKWWIQDSPRQFASIS
jgi:hypothetical protein